MNRNDLKTQIDTAIPSTGVAQRVKANADNTLRKTFADNVPFFDDDEGTLAGIVAGLGSNPKLFSEAVLKAAIDALVSTALQAYTVEKAGYLQSYPSLGAAPTSGVPAKSLCVIDGIIHEFDGTDWIVDTETLSGAAIIALINAEIGSDWQTGGSGGGSGSGYLPNYDTILAAPTTGVPNDAFAFIGGDLHQFDGTAWQNVSDELSDAEIVEAVNNELGGTDWQNGSGNQAQMLSTESFDFAGVNISDLQNSNNLIRTVYAMSSLSNTTLSTGPDGSRVSWDVTNDFPSDNAHRFELRQTDIALVPTLGTTEFWEYRFILHNYPSATAGLYSPVTIMQLFDHGQGTPRFSVKLTGEVQFSADNDRQIQTYSYENDSRIVHPNLLIEGGENVLKAVRFYDGSEGYQAWILNGSLLAVESNLDTTPSGGSGLQFGMYPHIFQDEASHRSTQVSSGETNFDFTFVSYKKEIYQGPVPASHFL